MFNNRTDFPMEKFESCISNFAFFIFEADKNSIFLSIKCRNVFFFGIRKHCVFHGPLSDCIAFTSDYDPQKSEVALKAEHEALCIKVTLKELVFAGTNFRSRKIKLKNSYFAGINFYGFALFWTIFFKFIKGIITQIFP